MRTIRQNMLSAVALIICMLTAQSAFAYYNPSTGRWLSRDPIGEPGFQALQIVQGNSQVGPVPVARQSSRWVSRSPIGENGGKNLYGFVSNSPVSLVDSLGLEPTGSGPWGPGLGNNWCSCKCKSVEVTYEPGDATMELGSYEPLIFGFIPSGQRFGSKVHVRWKVDGAPFLCHYYQDERGTTTKATGPGGFELSKAGSDGNEVAQVYTDYQGMDYTQILPGSLLSGTWTLAVHWNVTFRCVSENGSSVTRHDSKDVSGMINIP